jgi:hypothetical protein
MGCAESVPVSEIDLNRPHLVDPNVRQLGRVVKSKEMVQILVQERIFSKSSDNFGVKKLDGSSFHGIKILPAKMTLLDDKDVPVAVCIRETKTSCLPVSFKIYTLHPLYDGQAPSSHDYEGKRLYAYAEVAKATSSSNPMAKLDNETDFSYQMITTRFFPPIVVVKRCGVVAATIRAGTWGGNHYTNKISACPGIDPCLLLCINAISEKMDEIIGKETRRRTVVV